MRARTLLLLSTVVAGYNRSADNSTRPRYWKSSTKFARLSACVNYCSESGGGVPACPYTAWQRDNATRTTRGDFVWLGGYAWQGGYSCVGGAPDGSILWGDHGGPETKRRQPDGAVEPNALLGCKVQESCTGFDTSGRWFDLACTIRDLDHEMWMPCLCEPPPPSASLAVDEFSSRLSQLEATSPGEFTYSSCFGRDRYLPYFILGFVTWATHWISFHWGCEQPRWQDDLCANNGKWHGSPSWQKDGGRTVTRQLVLSLILAAVEIVCGLNMLNTYDGGWAVAHIVIGSWGVFWILIGLMSAMKHGACKGGGGGGGGGSHRKVAAPGGSHGGSGGLDAPLCFYLLHDADFVGRDERSSNERCGSMGEAAKLLASKQRTPSTCYAWRTSSALYSIPAVGGGEMGNGAKWSTGAELIVCGKDTGHRSNGKILIALENVDCCYGDGHVFYCVGSYSAALRQVIGKNNTNQTAYFWHSSSSRLIEKPKNRGSNWVGYPGYGWLFLWADAKVGVEGDPPENLGTGIAGVWEPARVASWRNCPVPEHDRRLYQMTISADGKWKGGRAGSYIEADNFNGKVRATGNTPNAHEGRGHDNTHGDYACRFTLLDSGELECAFGDYSVVYFFERAASSAGRAELKGRWVPTRHNEWTRPHQAKHANTLEVWDANGRCEYTTGHEDRGVIVVSSKHGSIYTCRGESGGAAKAPKLVRTTHPDGTASWDLGSWGVEHWKKEDGGGKEEERCVEVEAQEGAVARLAKTPDDWRKVWTLGCSASRGKISIWTPKVKAGEAYFGDAALLGKASPTNAPLVVADGPAFAAPVSFNRVWDQQRGGAVYIWAPVPPSDAFVALGDVATTSSKTPSPSDFPQLRCVSRSLLQETVHDLKGRKIWSDESTGGDDGSFWSAPTTGLFVVQGPGRAGSGGGRYPPPVGSFGRFVAGVSTTAKTGSTRATQHCKPGPRLTYADSEKYAKEKGGRLLTLEEARGMMQGKALYPGEDQWCAVQGRDWVQVGDRHHHPGKSHNLECGHYPPWGDDANNQTYGNPSWNYVALYTTGDGAATTSLEEVARTPGSFALILSGHHDHPDCNGRYKYDGEENGKPKWSKEGRGGSPKLFWTGRSWDCFWGGYSPESLSNTPVPPLDGYDKDKGGCEIRVSYERVKASSSDGIVKASSATTSTTRGGGEGTWAQYNNIDMCGQGDIEIIGDWKRHKSIDDLKRMVEEKGYSAFTVSNGQPSFGHAALKKFPFVLTKEHCKPITTCCRHPCTIYIYTPPPTPRERDVDGDPASTLDGHYFSFKTGGNPNDVVDRFEARQDGKRVTYYRNGPVGSTSRVHSASAKPMESYSVSGDKLHGPVTGTIQPNGDIEYSHGYTSRKEAGSGSKPAAGGGDATTVVMGEVVLGEVVVEAVAGAASSSASSGPTLVENVELFKRELGLAKGGNVKEVIEQAAEAVGVEPAGKPLSELAAEVRKVLGFR